MTVKSKEVSEEECGVAIGLESAGRRKAVKTIVGGVTALAAFHVLPAKWGTPVIEQVFLPAHAATSGELAPAAGGGEPAPAINVLANGNYSGTVPQITAVDMEEDFTDLIADAGRQIGNFFVAEAHADDAAFFNLDWHVSISGTTATFTGRPYDGVCISESGSASGVITYTDGADRNYTFRIVDPTHDTIKVTISVETGGGRTTYTYGATLNRTDDPAPDYSCDGNGFGDGEYPEA